MKNRSDYFWGVVLALSGALLFSTKAVMVKLAFRYEVDSISLLLLRMVFALPVYLVILGRVAPSQRVGWSKVSLKHWMGLIAAAILGYYLSSFLDFKGLEYIDASVERLILFVFPTIVALLNFFIFRERLTRVQMFALALSYLGLVFVFGENLGHISLDNVFWKGAGLIFTCAVTFASSYILSQWVIPFFGPTSFTSLCMTVACLFVIGHFSITGDFEQIFHLHQMVYLYAILMALFATVVPSYLINHAIKRLGATKVGILGSVGPISTITLAYIFLGEQLSFWQAIGAIFIIIGVTIVSREARLRRKPLK